MNTKKHLILVGFMGTGKTTVGKKLSKQMEIPWVDLDQWFEEQQKMTIDEYFTTYGEDSFRQKESQLLCKALEPSHSPTVVTTGGGIVLRSINQTQMKEAGWVYQLTASPSEIIRRVKQDPHRPLLKGNPETRVKQLLKEREGMYDFADWMIDTTDRTIDEIVQEILTHWQTNTV
ncbi:shikimate kinase [Hazenella coriacea]|uniref:Shikimate kinase n=1 Tax=Hazenella coriacea TaxID=1179467 RepID=A0A4R3L5M7_9BACL|nr:shikimate kinase [Hazenella coriacea]TCS94702.1 shikimate kinase [Hazenella coriacea]